MIEQLNALTFVLLVSILAKYVYDFELVNKKDVNKNC